MKKLLVLAGLVLMLTGCGGQQVYETVTDSVAETAIAEPMKIWVELPENADLQTAAQESGEQLYACGDLWICLQTMERGDLDRTLRQATGYGKDGVRLMESYSPYGKSYECAWITAGEGQTQVGRTRILDDGNYHYVLTVTVPESMAGDQQEQIRTIMASLALVDPQTQINTGS